MTIESDIIDKIVEICLAVPGINYVSFDKIKLATGDFAAHEIPAIQIWDNGQGITHERGRARIEWNISLELIMKSDFSGVVDQKALMELRRTIALALWAEPNLGIPGVIHLVYSSNTSDLHLLEPFYVARIDFAVMFYDNLTGSC
jgi:hypothetical protein